MAPDLLEFARQLAGVAEAEIVPRFRRVASELKSDGTVVTEADREAERAMTALIADRFPGHAVLGEEFGASGPAGARHRWILDPVDGTILFTLGVPTFGTLIGLLEDGQPLLGVARFPALGETLFARRGEGCWWQVRGQDPVRTRVAPAVPLEQARVSACGPGGTDLRPSDGCAANLTGLIRSAPRFRFLGDCLQHALVAQGRVHAAVDTIMKPWDVAALVPCVREAGGVATSLTGDDEGVIFAGSLVTSCDAGLHQQVLDILNRQGEAAIPRTPGPRSPKG
jgi:histidinol-phosphatase